MKNSYRLFAYALILINFIFLVSALVILIYNWKNINFVFPEMNDSIWILFISTLFIFIFSILFYYYKIRKKEFLFKISLIILRLDSMLILLMLILYPYTYILVKTETLENINLNIYIDNSKSIEKHFRNENLDYINTIKQIDKNLSNKNILVKYYIFGDTLQEINDFTEINLSYENTNIENVFKHINTSNDNSIILTDGVINSGHTKIYQNNKNKVNILGLGNKNKLIGDVFISDVLLTSLDNDSTKILIKINSTLVLDDYSMKIFLINNEKSIMIDQLNSINGNNLFIEKEIIVSDNIINEYSHIKIDAVTNEINLNNNLYPLIKKSNHSNKKILLITGSLSMNTNKIKHTLEQFTHYDLTHIYRINNNWNIDLTSIDSENYDSIVMDNFPFKQSDLNSIKKYNLDSSKMIYFLGPISNSLILNSFLSEYDYKLNENNIKLECTIDSKSNFYKWNSDPYLKSIIKNLPLNYQFNTIASNNKMSNSIYYSNNTCLLEKKEDKLFIFIANIFEYEARANINNNIDPLRKVITYYISQLVDGDNNQMSLFKYQDNYNSNELIKLTLKYPHLNSNDNVNIEIYDINQNIYKTIDSYENNSNLENSGDFLFKISDVGNYNIKANIITKDSIYITSNSINLNIENNNIESSNIYQDSIFLSNLSSRIPNGNYDDIKDLNNFLNLYEIKQKKIAQLNRYDVNLIREFWIMLVIFLILEWYLRKNKGLI